MQEAETEEQRKEKIRQKRQALRNAACLNIFGAKPKEINLESSLSCSSKLRQQQQKLNSSKDSIFKLKQSNTLSSSKKRKQLQSQNLSSSKKKSVITDKYQDLEEILGEGTESVVKKFRHLKNQKVYAVKIIRNADTERVLQMKQCYKLQKKLKHEYILSTYELFINEEEEHIYQTMEYLGEYCTLDRLTDRYSKKLDLDDIRKIIYSIIVAVEYMHEKGIVHRDLKPENIMVHKKDYSKIKICDFGTAKQYLKRDPDDKYSVLFINLWTRTGTLHYLAPEALSSIYYTQQVDMWSVGVILYQLITLKLPFYNEYKIDLIESIQNDEVKYDQEQFDWKKEISLKKLVKGLLVKDIKDRLNPSQAKNEIWFQTLKFSIKTYDDQKIINQGQLKQQQYIISDSTPLQINNNDLNKKIEGDDMKTMLQKINDNIIINNKKTNFVMAQNQKIQQKMEEYEQRKQEEEKKKLDEEFKKVQVGDIKSSVYIDNSMNHNRENMVNHNQSEQNKNKSSNNSNGQKNEIIPEQPDEQDTPQCRKQNDKMEFFKDLKQEQIGKRKSLFQNQQVAQNGDIVQQQPENKQIDSQKQEQNQKQQEQIVQIKSKQDNDNDDNNQKKQLEIENSKSSSSGSNLVGSDKQSANKKLIQVFNMPQSFENGNKEPDGIQSQNENMYDSPIIKKDQQQKIEKEEEQQQKQEPRQNIEDEEEKKEIENEKKNYSEQPPQPPQNVISNQMNVGFYGDEDSSDEEFENPGMSQGFYKDSDEDD